MRCSANAAFPTSTWPRVARVFAGERQQQVADCEAVQAQVLTRLDALDTDARRVRNGARLFSRIAFVLHALEGLPALRQRIATQPWAAKKPQASTRA